MPGGTGSLIGGHGVPLLDHVAQLCWVRLGRVGLCGVVVCDGRVITATGPVHRLAILTLAVRGGTAPYIDTLGLFAREDAAMLLGSTAGVSLLLQFLG